MRLSALLAAVLALLVCVTSAQGITLPPRTPDLAKMALASSDLRPGATVVFSGYSTPGSGLHLRAEYNRDFGASVTRGGVKLGQIQIAITLADTTSWARELFAQLPSIFATRSGHVTLALEVMPVGDGDVAAAEGAHFSPLRSAGIGQQSLFESATIAVRGTTLVAGFVFLRIDGVLASLAIAAPTHSLADSVAIGLARTVAARISSVLATGGAGR